MSTASLFLSSPCLTLVAPLVLFGLAIYAGVRIERETPDEPYRSLAPRPDFPANKERPAPLERPERMTHRRNPRG